MLASQAVLGAR